MPFLVPVLNIELHYHMSLMSDHSSTISGDPSSVCRARYFRSSAERPFGTLFGCVLPLLLPLWARWSEDLRGFFSLLFSCESAHVRAGLTDWTRIWSFRLRGTTFLFSSLTDSSHIPHESALLHHQTRIGINIVVLPMRWDI